MSPTDKPFEKKRWISFTKKISIHSLVPFWGSRQSMDEPGLCLVWNLVFEHREKEGPSGPDNHCTLGPRPQRRRCTEITSALNIIVPREPRPAQVFATRKIKGCGEKDLPRSSSPGIGPWDSPYRNELADWTKTME